MSSSSGHSQAMRIELPDATYKSLASLLGSSAASAASHLALLSPGTLSSSFTHYLATLPTQDAAQFARLLATSPALWPKAPSVAGEQGTVAERSEESSASKPAPSQVPSHARQRHDKPPSRDHLSTDLLARSQLVFEATARAVIGRIQVIMHTQKGKLTWTSQRPLVSWIRGIVEAVSVDAASIPSACRPVPIPSFAIYTGLVAGLQAARSQKEETNGKGLATSYALRKAEDEWCVALSVCMQLIAAELTEPSKEEKAGTHNEDVDDAWEREFQRASRKATKPDSLLAVDSHNDLCVATLYLAAQVASLIPEAKLTSLQAALQTISVLSDTILSLFQGSGVSSSLRDDVHQDAEGMLTLGASSPTAAKVQALSTHPLFGLLGPLSRLLSCTLSSAVRNMSPQHVQETLLGPAGDAPLARMRNISATWQSQWFGCRLAGARSDEIAESSRENTQKLWIVFKTLLFSYTMVFDALMEAIVEVCPTPTVTHPIPEADKKEALWQAETTSNIPPAYLEAVLSILITYSHLSWITATFGSSAFDAYRRVFFEALEVLSRDGRASLELAVQLAPLGDIPASPRVNAARRALDTYFLDVVEQVVAQLPDNLITDTILPLCRPYLENREYQETFESAHSVVLSMFSSEKPFILELTPYYIELLLASYPASLSSGQLTYAFSTVINAVSDRSDTVAWQSLETLWSALEAERYRAAATTPSEALAGASSGAPATERERTLGDVYIAQLAHVNLVLLRSLLRRVKVLILHSPAGSDARLHLCEQTFAALAGLDASTREEGVRWWLDERERFGV